MHLTALHNCQKFFDCYGQAITAMAPDAHVIEIGAQDVNGSLRSCCPSAFRYTGVDFVEGRGVDVVLQDPYVLPFPDASADVLLSSSCFEHAEMFWLSFMEILRVLRPGGLFYLNVPSNGEFHRWPVDCWRFYPDSGRALLAWARRNGLRPALLESYTSVQIGDQWNDFVAVFLKDESHVAQYPSRILDTKTDVLNGLVHGSDAFLNYSVMPEDKKKMQAISQIIDNTIKVS